MTDIQGSKIPHSLYGVTARLSKNSDIITLLLKNEIRKEKIGCGIKEIRIGKVQNKNNCLRLLLRTMNDDVVNKKNLTKPIPKTHGY